ncbi:cytochrome b [Ferrovibrio xuzhouensis]|uniref:Cytochrome b n=1 Tax=Ferrovibrio xuzhouensis TaxID=1576914 RepID=A0ABV7VMD4_9PROT
MSSLSPPLRFTLPARLFHWTIAAMIVLLYATDYLREAAERGSALRTTILAAHTTIGILVLGLTILRLGWRLHAGAPAPLGHSPLLRFAASTGHATLYGITLIMPVFGYLRLATRDQVTSFFGFPIQSVTGKVPWLYDIAHFIHGEFGEIFIIVVVAGHVAAALWHHYIIRDDTLRRMI